MPRPGKVLAVLVDIDGHPIIEVYASTRKLKPCCRYRVIGGQGERMSGSQGYSSLSNAKRGAVDLYQRLRLATWAQWEKP